MPHWHGRLGSDHARFLRGFALAGKRRRYLRALFIPSAVAQPMSVSSASSGPVEGELNAGVPGEVLDLRQVCPSPTQYGEAAMPLLTQLDPNLTLTRTQYTAIVGNTGNRKPLRNAGYANPCNYQQPLTAHS